MTRNLGDSSRPTPQSWRRRLLTLSASTTFSSTILLSGAVAGSMSMAPTSWGQSIADATFTAESLSPEQRQSIIDFVTAHAEKLASDDPEMISEARREVLDIYGRHAASGGSIASLSYFNGELVKALNGVLTDSSALTRINIAILAGRADDPSVVDLIAVILGDENVAVRYRAAAAVAELADRDRSKALDARLADSVWEELLEACAERLTLEQSPSIVPILLEAVSQIPLPQAQEQLLSILGERLGMHRRNPRLSMAADLGAFRTTISFINSRNDRESLLRQAMALAIRYMKLCQVQLAGGTLNPQSEEERFAMLRDTESYVLRDAAMNTFGMTETSLDVGQGELTNAIRTRDWATMNAIIDRWESDLAGPQLRIERSAMALD